MRQGLCTVFLDRDGVINEKLPEGEYVCSEGEFRVLPGVAEAIAKLNQAGLRVLVVSNQRGIALGRTTETVVRAIHHKLQNYLAARNAHLDGFYFCPHEKNACNCRKPLPGLFEQAVTEFGDIRAESSVMIGDSLSDIEFGRRLKMATVLIEGDARFRKPGSEAARGIADLCCASLLDAVDTLLASPEIQHQA